MRTFQVKASIFNGRFWRDRSFEVRATAYHVAAYRAAREILKALPKRSRTQHMILDISSRAAK